MKAALRVLRELDWWVLFTAVVLAFLGVLVIHSATQDDPDFAGQHRKQALFLAVSAVGGAVLVSVHYLRLARMAWLVYAAAVLSLALLPFFGSVVNGARRWYRIGGFSLQPGELAKVAVIVALASWLRYRRGARASEALWVPVLITAVPAVLILRQPDLGSSLVLWPVMLAMCYVAGARPRWLLGLAAAGAALVVVAYLFVLQDYQAERVHAWIEHFAIRTTTVDLANEAQHRDLLRGAGYQPWQALIAIGSGGATGFGLGAGPQNVNDFLPYRSVDYVFAVVAEELGFAGAAGVLVLHVLLAAGVLRIGLRTREPMGRLIAVGVGVYLGVQALLHAMVCTWLVPATGLPMPLLSYGGSSTLAAVSALALALNVGSRWVPVVAAEA